MRDSSAVRCVAAALEELEQAEEGSDGAGTTWHSMPVRTAIFYGGAVLGLLLMLGSAVSQAAFGGRSAYTRASQDAAGQEVAWVEEEAHEMEEAVARCGGGME